MSSESPLLGTPHYIQLDDQSFPVQLITAKVRSEWERRMAARARDRLDSLKRTKQITRKEYLAELREIGQREDRGEFGLLTPASIGTINSTVWGQRTLLTLLMPNADPGLIDRLMEEKTDEVYWVLEKIFQDSIPQTLQRAKKALKEREEDPFEANGNGHDQEKVSWPTDSPRSQSITISTSDPAPRT